MSSPQSVHIVVLGRQSYSLAQFQFKSKQSRVATPEFTALTYACIVSNAAQTAQQKRWQTAQETVLNTFTLYGTEACHLCELAQKMLIDAISGSDQFQVELVDISEAEDLFERYGIRIPVVQHADQRELDWPFTPDELLAFLHS
jgi:hypothetical protein